MELEDRAAALLVLQGHLVQDVGQAGAGDDVLGVLGERLHLADDVTRAMRAGMRQHGVSTDWHEWLIAATPGSSQIPELQSGLLARLEKWADSHGVV